MAQDGSTTGSFFEDLNEGMSAAFTKMVTEADIIKYAAISGDTNPVHLDADYAAATMFKERIAHGMLTAGFISAVFGTKLPGPGSIYVNQSLKFRAPVKIGDTVTATVTVTGKVPEKKFVTFSTVCTVNDKPVLEGEATLMVPAKG
jgi:3-hydroxybutyryl-CoA dehydratase